MPRVTALVLLLALTPSAATAETTLELGAGLNLAYSAGEAEADALATDIRPSLSLQVVSRRLAWSLGYVFSGSLLLDGSWGNSYGNTVRASLAARLTPRSTGNLSISATQGGTAFRLSQRAPEDGQAAIRAPTEESRVSLGAAQGFNWEASPEMRLNQGFDVQWSAPQARPDESSAALGGLLGLERHFARDAVGASLRPVVSFLGPSELGGARRTSLSTALVASWRRDLGPRWSAGAAAGGQAVVALDGDGDVAFLPTGSLSVSFLHVQSGVSAGVDLRHAAATNLETASVSSSDQATVRAALGFGPRREHSFGASAGYNRSRALGGELADGSGSGDALQADAGLSWTVAETVLATARYSLAYQFGQPEGVESSLIHVALIGVVVRYRNVRAPARMPSLSGARVDGSDAVAF